MELNKRIHLKGLAVAKEKIIELRAKKDIPYFILSGQKRLENDATFSQTYGEYYKKQNQQDVIRLFKDIKEAAAKQPYTKIRHKHQKVFDVCTKNYIGEDASKYLIDILYSIEYPEKPFDDEKHFNGLRKIVELVFIASMKIGILHHKLERKDKSIILAWSSLFIRGEDNPDMISKGIKKTNAYLPKILGKNLESILDIANAASHPANDADMHNWQEYKKQIQSNYLLYSLTFQTMDLLLWFKKYADENPDIEKNKSVWNKVE